ncbi:hypothetical protein DC28_01195 [Spirochaeta lutea]|uniref:Probable nicotinate-nucleotide pyrophosphorylase [carboxylating] n=2 Tax=Spirochaeta lutea TaxID=1480694 RepID=A0A098R170_9SPIO|nr:hypothetical protein DC28_01195 [Spirochaeta lutea]
MPDDPSFLQRLLELSLEEDLDSAGDITTQAVFSQQTGGAKIVARERGVLSGTRVVQEVFHTVDPGLTLRILRNDSEAVEGGDCIIEVIGKISSILTAERLALNFLGYLSGVATKTRHYQEILSAVGDTQILDTRKTIPGLRRLSKQAVRDGGGRNHRMGLYDMVMLKDNHIDAAGGIRRAVDAVRQVYGTKFLIEVECRSLEDVQQALDAGADWIMLDNMSPRDCEMALSLRQDRGRVVPFEASGDMDEEKLRVFGSLGLDYISAGKLTHSVQTMNFSLQFTGALD